jgi:hypothetical protein
MQSIQRIICPEKKQTLGSRQCYLADDFVQHLHWGSVLCSCESRKREGRLFRKHGLQLSDTRGVL